MMKVKANIRILKTPSLTAYVQIISRYTAAIRTVKNIKACASKRAFLTAVSDAFPSSNVASVLCDYFIMPVDVLELILFRRSARFCFLKALHCTPLSTTQ